MPGDPAQMLRAGAMPPNGVPNPAASNHALQDYQMQLMLLEQQNKRRLLMARQEHEVPLQPGMTGMSPQGSRGVPSPGPGGERRGETPKMGQQGLPGSPLPDGSMRNSPGAMFNGMPPEMYANGMRHPGNLNLSNGAFNPQLEMMRQRMANGTWQGPNASQQPGPQGLVPPHPSGTPQQRNDMPPPQGPPQPGVSGRPGDENNGNPANNPPTPQPANKANPKASKKKADPKVRSLPASWSKLMLTRPSNQKVKDRTVSPRLQLQMQKILPGHLRHLPQSRRLMEALSAARQT